VGHTSALSLVIIPIYVVSMGSVYRYERDNIAEYEEESGALYPNVTLRQAALRYAAGALVVVGAGSALPFVAENLSLAMHWNQSFVGNLFVAFATSLPETVVTFAAIRLGAVDMAVGNVLGSNLFNILIIAIDDLLFLPGSLYQATEPSHSVSGITAIIMTGVVSAGLMSRTRARIFGTIGWPSAALIALYLLNAYTLYRLAL